MTHQATKTKTIEIQQTKNNEDKKFNKEYGDKILIINNANVHVYQCTKFVKHFSSFLHPQSKSSSTNM